MSHSERALLGPSGQKLGATGTLQCPAQRGIRSDGSVVSQPLPWPRCCAGGMSGKDIQCGPPNEGHTAASSVHAWVGVPLGGTTIPPDCRRFSGTSCRQELACAQGHLGGSLAVTVDPERASLDLGLQSGSPLEHRTRAACGWRGGLDVREGKSPRLRNRGALGGKKAGVLRTFFSSKQTRFAARGSLFSSLSSIPVSAASLDKMKKPNKNILASPLYISR